MVLKIVLKIKSIWIIIVAHVNGIIRESYGVAGMVVEIVLSVALYLWDHVFDIYNVWKDTLQDNVL